MPDLPLWLYLCLALIASTLYVFIYLRVQRLERQQHTRRIHLLHRLRQLLSLLQKHRGLSAGILSGDKSLSADRAVIQQEIQSLLKGAQTEQVLLAPFERWHTLTEHWGRLQANQQLDVRACLLQHHQLIRTLLFLIEDLAEASHLAASHPELEYLPWVWKGLLPSAEWAGQARALGTAVSAKGCSTPAERIRLRFLCQQLREESSHTLQRLKAQPDLQKSLLPAQAALQQFLWTLETQILQENGPPLNAKEFFALATQAIESLLAIADDALTHALRVHQETNPHLLGATTLASRG